MALVLWRRESADFLNWPDLALVVLLVAGIVWLREAGMAGVARWRGIVTRHYGWESGSLIAIPIALVFRGFFSGTGQSLSSSSSMALSRYAIAVGMDCPGRYYPCFTADLWMQLGPALGLI